MTSEQVAQVLRQFGVHVRLIVARSVEQFFQPSTPLAAVIPASQLDNELERINRLLTKQPALAYAPDKVRRGTFRDNYDV